MGCDGVCNVMWDVWGVCGVNKGEKMIKLHTTFHKSWVMCVLCATSVLCGM